MKLNLTDFQRISGLSFSAIYQNLRLRRIPGAEKIGGRWFVEVADECCDANPTNPARNIQGKGSDIGAVGHEGHASPIRIT
jgi:hypothetical protein